MAKKKKSVIKDVVETVESVEEEHDEDSKTRNQAFN
jgi:hypothetical protein